MQLTVVGCGDAFGSGGRFNTCFLVESSGKTLALDFGASSMVALKHHGISPNVIDGVVLSHLHGDHFGALPFLLLDSQFDTRREKPLTIVGPMGTRERVLGLMEAMFPGSSKNKWRFPFEILDLPCRTKHSLLGFDIETIEVVHPSGAPPTGLRVSDGNRLVAFSGDTEWTDALVDIAAGADLFISECYRFDKPAPYHLDFKTIAANRARLTAKTMLLTHLGASMLPHIEDAEAAGYQVASDGLVLEI
jgi:ribonuclease BN (tRNA processing enzyme)